MKNVFKIFGWIALLGVPVAAIIVTKSLIPASVFVAGYLLGCDEKG